MVGNLFFSLVLGLLMVGCSHMDPNFWPESFNIPKRVSKTADQTDRSPAQVPFKHVTREPSMGRCEWKMTKKTGFSEREYELTLRDREGAIIDTDFPPEIILDGEVNVTKVHKRAPGRWRVMLDFQREQSIVHVGFALGDYRVEHFRRLHWQLHHLDMFQSRGLVNKLVVRVDGKDSARFYIHMRDSYDYPIYQAHDFALKVKVTQGHAKIEGPFETLSGPYFMVRPLREGEIHLQASIDGEKLGEPQILSSVKTTRVPASDAQMCLDGLAKFVGIEREDHPADEEFRRIGVSLRESFSMLITPTEIQVQTYLKEISSPACVANVEFDQAREEVAEKIRRLSLRANRLAGSNRRPGSVWGMAPNNPD